MGASWEIQEGVAEGAGRTLGTLEGPEGVTWGSLEGLEGATWGSLEVLEGATWWSPWVLGPEELPPSGPFLGIIPS